MHPSMQHFQSDRFGSVVFEDRKHAHTSAPCHPRDIEIIEGPDSPRLKEEIAIDIRIGQGENPIGVAKNLKY